MAKGLEKGGVFDRIVKSFVFNIFSKFFYVIEYGSTGFKITFCLKKLLHCFDYVMTFLTSFNIPSAFRMSVCSFLEISFFFLNLLLYPFCISFPLWWCFIYLKLSFLSFMLVLMSVFSVVLLWVYF